MIEKDYQGAMRRCVWSLLIMAICVFLALMASGCRSVRYVTVPEIHTEYITKTDTFIERDSILKHDSVVVRMQGDTVYCDRWHTQYRDRWRDRVRIDSIIKVDSVAVPYPVEKKLTRWQQVKLDLGGWMVGIILAGVAVAIVYFARRRIM